MDKKIPLSSSLEDYLEAIFNLTQQDEVARSKDIASQLNVAKPSVTAALKTLAEKGLVNYKPYGYVTLTDMGFKQAEFVARKHDIITSFFVDILGVENATAQKAACRAEHTLGPKIISKLRELIKFINHSNNKKVNFITEFREFQQNQ